MKEHSTRMLLGAVALSTLAAVPASGAQARIPEGAAAAHMVPTVIAQPVVIPYLSHGIGVGPSLFARRTRDRRAGPRVPPRARAASNSTRLFIWPTLGTSTYERAAGMALHGDPEARSFVDGRSDVNPFDAR